MIPPSSDFNAYEPPAPQAEPLTWTQAWIKAVTKPAEATYQQIGYSPNASFWRPAIWLFVASLIGTVITVLLSLVFGTPQFAQLEQQTGFELGSAVGLIGLFVCFGPLSAAISVGLAALGVALIQWIAKLFGGTGDFNALWNAFGAFAAPIGLVSALFAAIPYVGACIGGLLGIYQLVLSVISVQAINRFGYGKAIAAVLIPFALLLTCCCIFYFAIAATFLGAMGGLQGILTPAP